MNFNDETKATVDQLATNIYRMSQAMLARDEKTFEDALMDVGLMVQHLRVMSTEKEEESLPASALKDNPPAPMSIARQFVHAWNDLSTLVHSANIEKGFWDDGSDRNKGELIALIHSELSEALEATASRQPAERAHPRVQRRRGRTGGRGHPHHGYVRWVRLRGRRGDRCQARLQRHPPAQARQAFLMTALPAPKKLRTPDKRPLERSIESKVCTYAKARDFLVYKFQSPNHRSVPDRMFVNPDGVVFFIEFKREGEKPTDGQTREIGKLRAYEQAVYVCDSVEDGKGIIDQYVGLL